MDGRSVCAAEIAVIAWYLSRWCKYCNHNSSSTSGGSAVHLHVCNLDALGQAISKLSDKAAGSRLQKTSTTTLIDCEIPDAYRRDPRFQDRGLYHPSLPHTCRDNCCRRASMPHCRSDLHEGMVRMAKRSTASHSTKRSV